MIFHKSALRITETYNIKLNDSILVKLEDGYRNNKELLINIDASHYGMLNGNGVIYRHSTVKNNIGTFIFPYPKPIIKNHRPKESKVFGRIIAADYKLTDYYDYFASKNDIEDMTTDEYIAFCKDTIIPFQKVNPQYNGLAYCEVTGKIDDKEAIRKVLKNEFLSVSIGADPKTLFCSDCLQDQVLKLCDHFHSKGNDIFMLSEELEYEELSFLENKKPADPFGRITYIQDGIEKEFEYELNNNWINSNIDLIEAKDFFKLTDNTKTIVCVDNICRIINREEKMARKQEDQKPVFNISYTEEFDQEKLKSLKLSDNVEDQVELDIESLSLTDEIIGEMKNSDFAIVQKTEEGTKRRFPLNSKESVIVANKLIDEAKDVTEAEIKKAKIAIGKAAKKFEVELKDESALSNKNTSSDAEVDAVTKLVDELKSELSKIEDLKLKDEEKSPISKIFDMLYSLASNLKWAGEGLQSSLDWYLKEKGLEAINKGQYDSLKDQVTSLTDELEETKEEVQLLDELNRDLNVQLRKSVVDEIVDCKEVLGLIKDSVDDESSRLFKQPYDILTVQLKEYRELKSKLKDNNINNKAKDIKKVSDPTLKDSEGDENVTLEDTKKDLSPEELRQLFLDLFKGK